VGFGDLVVRRLQLANNPPRHLRFDERRLMEEHIANASSTKTAHDFSDVSRFVKRRPSRAQQLLKLRGPSRVPVDDRMPVLERVELKQRRGLANVVHAGDVQFERGTRRTVPQPGIRDAVPVVVAPPWNLLYGDAVLSLEGTSAGRLRQVRLHGGLHVPGLRRHVDSRGPSVSNRFERYRFPAERFMARWPGPSTSRTSASNSGLNGVTTPFAAARLDRAD
jgi:hypothetical protein